MGGSVIAVNYREILRLHSLGYSQRQIASSVRSSRDTVSQVCRLAAVHGLEWPLPDEVTNQVIRETFFPSELDASPRRTPDYAKMHKELAKPGVTLTLLWADYCEACYSENATPYQYTQFCDNYRKWARATKATMRIKRKPGDVFEVDWAGNTMPVYDRVTGEQYDACIFVVVLPCSGYAYVEAFPSMVTEELAVWSTATVRSDYLITDGINKYSVPFDLIGEEVHIRLTSRTIEAFFNGSRVASYPRETVQKRDPIVKVEHMPDNHKKYLMYNEEAFLEWASSVGPNTLAVVQQFLTGGTVAEQGFKSCASLMRLADRYGHNRLESACAGSLGYTSTPNIKTIDTILRTGHDKIEQEAAAKEGTPGSRCGFTRGAAYFGGEQNDQPVHN
jgi:hypothetical protein